MSLPFCCGYAVGQPPSPLPLLPPKVLWLSCSEAEEAEELRLTGRSLSEQTVFTEVQLPSSGSEAMPELIPPSEEADEGLGAAAEGRQVGPGCCKGGAPPASCAESRRGRGGSAARGPPSPRSARRLLAQQHPLWLLRTF